ncbi:hypothetical protein AC1031_012194 [Aphanomyces cochlioides]|nr:hypothetical protein AC1031_012194 [Aphanomyces cochlioides]
MFTALPREIQRHVHPWTPGTFDSVNESFVSVGWCRPRVTAVIDPAFSSDAIKNCAKDIQTAAPSWWAVIAENTKQVFNSTVSFFSSGDWNAPTLKAFNDSKVCQQWYTGVSSAIQQIDPPCSFAVSNATQILTSKWNYTLTEFLELSKKWNVSDLSLVANTTKVPGVNNSTNPSSSPSAAPTTTGATTTTAAPTTTAAKSSASVVAAGLTTVVALAVAAL